MKGRYLSGPLLSGSRYLGSSIGRKQKLTLLSEFYGNKPLSIGRNIKVGGGGVVGVDKKSHVSLIKINKNG